MVLPVYRNGGGGLKNGTVFTITSCSFTKLAMLVLVALVGVVIWRGNGNPWMSSLNEAAAFLSVETGTDDLRSLSSPPNEQTAKESQTCTAEGSQTPPNDVITIDFNAVKAINKNSLDLVSHHTIDNYRRHMMNDAGKEHYALLHYISTTYGDCRHFMDIGTRYVASALALGSNFRTPVWTFDLPDSKERLAAFRGKAEGEWQSAVKSSGVSVTFYNLDLLEVPDPDFRRYTGTWFIMLDTHHLPYTVPFEREFFQRLLDTNFRGILGLDDIHLNDEMRRWWTELKDNAAKGGYTVHDVTAVGHVTGTGLVDFSGRVRLTNTQ